MRIFIIVFSLFISVVLLNHQPARADMDSALSAARLPSPPKPVGLNALPNRATNMAAKDLQDSARRPVFDEDEDEDEDFPRDDDRNRLGNLVNNGNLPSLDNAGSTFSSTPGKVQFQVVEGEFWHKGYKRRLRR